MTTTQINQLPNELLSKCFLYLEYSDPKDLYSASCVCKKWDDLARGIVQAVLGVCQGHLHRMA